MQDRMLEEAAQGSSHYQGIAGSKYFDWQNRNGEITGKIEARKFQAYIKPSDVVLDFGCGGGNVLRNLTCKRRVGIEINPIARAVAIREGIECHDSIAAVDDNSFDVVISNHALEHVRYPIGTLTSLLSKLKSTGALVLCVPIDDWRTQTKYDSNDMSHHLYSWTPQLLGNLLLECGLTAEQFAIRLVTHAWFPGVAQIYGSIPNTVFDILCTVYAAVIKRRQLIAVIKKRSE